jgi:hypothetical protein
MNQLYIALVFFATSSFFYGCKKENVSQTTNLPNVTKSPFTVKYDVSFSQDLTSGTWSIQSSPADYPSGNLNLVTDKISYPSKSWTKTITVTTNKRPLDIDLTCFVKFSTAAVVNLSISINGSVAQKTTFNKAAWNGDGVGMNLRIN